MNKDDEIREELSDLWCKEITGQLKGSEKIRLQNLIEEREFPFPDRKRWLARLRQKEEFDSAIAYRKFLQYKNRKRWWRFGRIGLTAAAAVLLFVGIGLVWSHREQLRSVPPLTVKNEVVEPGRSKAMITLANGEKIVLGDKKQQLIGEDGTLLNLDSAVVEYKGKQKTPALVYNTIDIPIGGEYQLVLADGTKVWLNADSKLRFPVSFTAERREVYLEGEAYFEVAKDSAREFWVHAGAMDVKVLGTSFNVKAYERLETVATTLVEGSVEVACAGKSFQIVPGEQFVYDKNNRVMDVRMVDTESYVSWKDGYYKFRQTTLEEIMETLSVWYGLNVFYVNESAKQVEFTGKVKRYEDARMLLDKFEQTGDVVFDIKGNNVFITIKQKKPFAREWNSFLVKARGMVWQS